MVGLLLDHRLGWPRGGYRVRVPMHHLPGALFGPEDARDAKGHGRDILPPANLGPVALHLHDAGKLRAYVLGYRLKADDLAIPIARCGTLHIPSGLIPSTYGREKGVGEAHLFSMRVQHLQGLGVPLTISPSARWYRSSTWSRSSTAAI